MAKNPSKKAVSASADASVETVAPAAATINIGSLCINRRRNKRSIIVLTDPSSKLYINRHKVVSAVGTFAPITLPTGAIFIPEPVVFDFVDRIKGRNNTQYKGRFAKVILNGRIASLRPLVPDDSDPITGTLTITLMTDDPTNDPLPGPNPADATVDVVVNDVVFVDDSTP